MWGKISPVGLTFGVGRPSHTCVGPTYIKFYFLWTQLNATIRGEKKNWIFITFGFLLVYLQKPNYINYLKDRKEKEWHEDPSISMYKHKII